MTAGWDGAAAPEVGRRVAEEAARLLSAFQEAANTHTGAECRICPICQAIARLRQMRPEAVDHLTLAAVEFAAALREVLVPAAPAGPPEPWATGRPAGRPEPGPVEHIDISD